MKENITKFDHCYGCGVCIPACPMSIITIEENGDGFYSPNIKEPKACINCGICLKVCAFNHESICKAEINDSINAYIGYSNNPKIRSLCSSGGIGFELGQLFIENGYKAVGVRYNPQLNRAEHFIASSVNEYIPSIGSKYIPSYTAEAFKEIDLKKKYFVSGTPCQIDSFRRYIRLFKKEKNFFLIDFFCHGVPSLLLWDKYSNEIKEELGNFELTTWRNKRDGWHDSYAISLYNINLLTLFKKDNITRKECKPIYFSKLSEGDKFLKLFLGNVCLNKCCYSDCKYKCYSSAADIRVGDLWGNKYEKDDRGLNGVLSFSSEGLHMLNILSKSGTYLKKGSLSEVTSGQMKKKLHKPWIREYVIRDLKSSKSLKQIYNTTYRWYNISLLPKRLLKKIRRSLNNYL